MTRAILLEGRPWAMVNEYLSILVLIVVVWLGGWRPSEIFCLERLHPHSEITSQYSPTFRHAAAYTQVRFHAFKICYY